MYTNQPYRISSRDLTRMAGPFGYGVPYSLGLDGGSSTPLNPLSELDS